MEERYGGTTFVETPLTLVGREIEVGDGAADFEVFTTGLERYSRDDGKGELRPVAAVPSPDTPVCQAEILRLSQEAKALENVRVLVVSADLPFAQERWRREHGVDNATFVSDHRDLLGGPPMPRVGLERNDTCVEVRERARERAAAGRSTWEK